jgi:hypothetical protein
VRGRILELLLGVLAVDGEQPLPEPREGADGSRFVLDERASPSVRGELPAQEDRPSSFRKTGLGEDAPHPVVRIELARHGELRRARADERRGPPSARQQGQGVDQDRLAGAGLSRDDRQSFRKVDLQVLDDCEVPDRQPAEHAGKHSAGAAGRFSTAGRRLRPA